MVLLKNHLTSHLKIKKLRDSSLEIGQSSLPMLNRLGTHMYWNNLWVNTFNKKSFLNKSIFLEDLIYYLFSEKIFFVFFRNKTSTFLKRNSLFKSFFLKKCQTKKRHLFFIWRKKRYKKKKTTSYNFTRAWLIKFNNYILVTTFVFFYFKIKKIKKLKKLKLKPSRYAFIFWKKKRGRNTNRALFFRHNYLSF